MTDSSTTQINYPSEEARQNPYPIYAQMRDERPIFREPQTGVFFVSRYDDINEMLRNPELFSSRRKLIPDNDPELEAIRAPGFPDSISMGSSDPPEHKHYRGMVARIFTPKRFSSLEPKIRALTNAYIDEFIAEGEADLHSQFSLRLPLTVVADLLDLPHADIPKMKGWTDDYTRLIGAKSFAITRAQFLEYAQSLTDMQLYFADVIDARAANPGEDAISLLIKASEASSRPLDKAELIDMMRIFLIGGNETTTMALSTMMYVLLSRPGEYQRLQANPSLIPAAVEECLRFEPPNQWVLRTVTRDTTLGGMLLPAGSIVAPLWGSANHQADKFGANAESFDMDRPTATPHLTFGLGNHFCAGSFLARMELRIALETYLQRLKNLRLRPGQHAQFGTHPVNRGLEYLLVQFDPA